jgi:hypothetical protein
VTGHQHEWRPVAHIDGCHFYGGSSVCECGATLTQRAERDISDDPYSAEWMGDDPTCERCRELLDGAVPEGVHEDLVEVAR